MRDELLIVGNVYVVYNVYERKSRYFSSGINLKFFHLCFNIISIEKTNTTPHLESIESVTNELAIETVQ